MIAAAVIFSAAPPVWAQTAYDAHTQVELVSNLDVIRAGEPFEAAVRMKTDPGWHVYWKNSGDSGLPPSIQWHLPPGFRSGAIHWPVPERMEESGLTTYGYPQGVFLIADITPPPAIAETTVTLKAVVDWLACERICVPGKADLLLNLSVGPVSHPGIWDNDFTLTRALWPPQSPWPVSAFQDNHFIYLHVDVPPGERAEILSLEFFPDKNDVIAHSGKQSSRVTAAGIELTVPRSMLQNSTPDALSGLLIVREARGGKRAVAVDIPRVEALAAAAAPPAARPGLSLWAAILFAFIGGLILNLMPCVLPVLSIKVLSLIEHAGERKKALLSGGVFALGVLMSCWFLAGLLIFLKAAGRQVGWGFQFQSPGFIIVLCLVLFLFALNLSGVFEIGMLFPRAAGYINRRYGYSRSFFSGVLAMVLATPCTAPFMGVAIGFAVTQGAFVNILIFTFLGLGMALPYVLLSAFPQCLKFVPRPGPWMGKFKKILALLLMATIAWLVWILSYLAAPVTLVALATGLVLMGIGGKFLGRQQTLAPKNQWLRRLAIFLVVGSAAVPFARIELNKDKIIAGAQETDQSIIHWLDYSPELMQQLRASGRIVFLDFTAKWCVSCQVNERVALRNKKVADKFRDLGVTAVKADWTRFDARITQALAQLGKNSIPVYVIYCGENHQNMKILPEVITAETVLKALDSVR